MELWTYLTWDCESRCYRQCGFYLTRDEAEEARSRDPRQWGDPSGVYSVSVPEA